MLAQPTATAGLLCLIFGTAALIRGYRLFLSRLAERRAVERLYDLTYEEAVQRRLLPSRRATA